MNNELSKNVRDDLMQARATQALLEQAEILELAPLIVRDMEGRIVRWSIGAQQLYGYTIEQAVGNLAQDLLKTRFPEPTANIQQQLEKNGVWKGELSRRTQAGHPIDVASIWVLHRDEDNKPSRILESNIDLTERKLTEHKLSAQMGQLSLLNTITRAIAERQDLNSISQVVTRALEEQMPVDFSCLCLFHEPDALVIAAIDAKLRILEADPGLVEHGQIPVGENGLAHCVKGEIVYEPDLGAMPFPFPQRLAAAGLRAMVAAPLLVEQRVFGVLIVARQVANSFNFDEREFLRQLSEHVALAAHQAQLYGALEASNKHLRDTQEAVLRQEKLRLLGQMASGMAHDINNTLAPAALYVEMLLDRDMDQTETRECLRVIQLALDGVAQTVSRMNQVNSSRERPLQRTSLDLNRILEQVMALTRARWNSMPQQSGFVIDVVSDLAPSLPEMLGDTGEIRDALTNLILNAVDAMPEGGHLRLHTRAVDQDRVRIEIGDSGMGMDDTTRNRCQELFFTTKGTRGTGLGLTMVQGTVERHGGILEIESAVGVGTTIRITLPVGGASRATPIAPESTATHPLSILVVDDEPVILKSLVTILEHDGHRVETADGGQSGIDAVRAALDRGRPFDLVITDLGMPYVDGKTVAAAVKAMRPLTSVILLTGWGQGLLEADHPPKHVDVVLAKPSKVAAIRNALARLSQAVTGDATDRHPAQRAV